MTLSRRETIILLLLIVCFIVLNIISYVKKERLKTHHLLYVEELSIEISINEADSHDLESLPGIGPTLAQRIIAYRHEHGSFEALEELKNVRGIGEKLFQKILPYVKL